QQREGTGPESLVEGEGQAPNPAERHEPHAGRAEVARGAPAAARETAARRRADQRGRERRDRAEQALVVAPRAADVPEQELAVEPERQVSLRRQDARADPGDRYPRQRQPVREEQDGGRGRRERGPV